ncbi:MAG: DUF192 domain-containing protein [Patescibacteria group bacterium]|nr:DUF192 domain-containing protein [Patescibacteria group bacterium]
MKFFKKIFLSVLVFVLVAVMGVVYILFMAKNKTAIVKIGNNVFDVEIADTAGQQAKGLSFRDSLDKNKGMLFDFGKETTPTFWMMGMKFPLDIIWINSGKIVGIDKNISAPTPGTPENALKLYNAPGPIGMVLEINAGLCDELGISIGDEVSISR